MTLARRTWTAALAWAFVSVLTWAALASWLNYGATRDLPVVQQAALVAGPPAPAPAPEAIPDRVGRGESLSDVLDRNGFTAAEVHDIALALSAVMDVRRLRPGNELEILFDGSGEARTIRIHRHDLTRIELSRSDLGWQSQSESVPLERRVVSLSGTLEGNLFSSIGKLGEGAPLVIAFANVFAWDFDFYTQSRDGDRFSVVFEKLYREGEFVSYGTLLAARYVSTLSQERPFSAYRFEDGDGASGYYDEDGKSTKKAFLRAPLEFERISSGFSHSRLHPIHKTRRPHLGVDYAARTGTPVYSVAAGTVTGRSFSKGNGNMVTIKHAMGYQTKYLHLSRFAEGLRVGRRVAQKEVIGYVGMTGSATGPHLDFRLIQHGRAVNPLTQIFPPGPPVAADRLEAFHERRRRLARLLAVPEGPGRAVAVDDS